VLKGGMYLALTPRCVMAGGFLDGTWQTSGGGIKASFGVYADFLVAWRPFFYDARVRANFSVVATIEWWWTWTLSVSVGADLHIWGPEFSGTAYINLSVISFTIPFGNANQNGPPPIHWSEFRTSFLGERGSVVRTMVSAGLLKTLEPAKARVDPEQLVLYAQTLVPAKKLSLNSSDLPETWKKDFGVGPMALAPDAVTSEIAVTVKRDGVEDGGLLATAVRKPAPVALWRYEPSLMAQLSAPALLQNIAQGVELKPPAAEARHSLAVDVAALGHESEVTVRCEWGADPAPAGDPFGHLKPWTTLTETIGDARVAAARADVVSALYSLEFGVSPDIDVAPLEQRDLLGLLDPPQLSLLGEDKEPAVL
jgi:hypothetical protein